MIGNIQRHLISISTGAICAFFARLFPSKLASNERPVIDFMLIDATDSASSDMQLRENSQGLSLLLRYLVRRRFYMK